MTTEELKVCKCSMRIKMVGDGCEVCNPELAAEYAELARLDALQELVDQAQELDMGYGSDSNVIAAPSVEAGLTDSCVIQDDREAFEAWWKSENKIPDLSAPATFAKEEDGTYLLRVMREEWIVWQAALLHARKK